MSTDVFKGFGSNTGSDSLWDWGGTADVADLKPFSASEVYVNAVDLDGTTTTESLQIVTSPTTQVLSQDTSANIQTGPAGSTSRAA